MNPVDPNNQNPTVDPMAAPVAAPTDTTMPVPTVDPMAAQPAARVDPMSAPVDPMAAPAPVTPTVPEDQNNPGGMPPVVPPAV